MINRDEWQQQEKHINRSSACGDESNKIEVEIFKWCW